jgi:hypothetical protein
MNCCPYHRDGGYTHLGCVNPFAQPPPVAECECDKISEAVRGTLLCPMRYPEDEDMQILLDLLIGGPLTRRQKHAINTLIRDRHQTGKTIQDALISEIFPSGQGQLFRKMDELKNRLLKK